MQQGPTKRHCKCEDEAALRRSFKHIQPLAEEVVGDNRTDQDERVSFFAPKIEEHAKNKKQRVAQALPDEEIRSEAEREEYE